MVRSWSNLGLILNSELRPKLRRVSTRLFDVFIADRSQLSSPRTTSLGTRRTKLWLRGALKTKIQLSSALNFFRVGYRRWLLELKTQNLLTLNPSRFFFIPSLVDSASYLMPRLGDVAFLARVDFKLISLSKGLSVGLVFGSKTFSGNSIWSKMYLTAVSNLVREAFTLFLRMGRFYSTQLPVIASLLSKSALLVSINLLPVFAPLRTSLIPDLKTSDFFLTQRVGVLKQTAQLALFEDSNQRKPSIYSRLPLNLLYIQRKILILLILNQMIF